MGIVIVGSVVLLFPNAWSCLKDWGRGPEILLEPGLTEGERVVTAKCVTGSTSVFKLGRPDSNPSLDLSIKHGNYHPKAGESREPEERGGQETPKASVCWILFLRSSCPLPTGHQHFQLRGDISRSGKSQGEWRPQTQVRREPASPPTPSPYRAVLTSSFLPRLSPPGRPLPSCEEEATRGFRNVAR